MEIKRIFTFISILLFGVTTFGQKNRIIAVENNLTETREFIFEDSIVQKYNIVDRMKFYKIPFVSIALINNGKIEWVKSYGYAAIAEKREPDANTMYQVASISKSVNSLGILRLVQDGKLSLSKDIRTI